MKRNSISYKLKITETTSDSFDEMILGLHQFLVIRGDAEMIANIFWTTSLFKTEPVNTKLAGLGVSVFFKPNFFKMFHMSENDQCTLFR